jgi:hypothetical protein
LVRDYELTYCRAEAWKVLCQRIRQPQAKSLEGFAVWTPKGFDWVYQNFISPLRRLPGYEAIIAGAMENVAVLDVHPEYYESLKAQYDDRFYRQEVLGEYLNLFAGACYHSAGCAVITWITQRQAECKRILSRVLARISHTRLGRPTWGTVRKLSLR